MLFKDAYNMKNQQHNLGIIKSSNYTIPTEIAGRNLASIALPRYAREKGVPMEAHPSKRRGSSRNRYFDFDKLGDVGGLEKPKVEGGGWMMIPR